MTGAAPKLGLPTPRFLAGARQLAALVPMADDDIVLFGGLDGLPSPAVLRGPGSRLSFGWTGFAQKVMAAHAPSEECAPFAIVVGDRLRTLRLSAPTLHAFETGEDALPVQWRALVTGRSEPLGDRVTQECPTEITADGLLADTDEAALRWLFQPLQASSHESLEFEMALLDALSAPPL
jgi:hypothetical protein